MQCEGDVSRPFRTNPRLGSRLLCMQRKGGVSGTPATILAWAQMVALSIAWDTHVKFKFFLKTTRRDEWDMSPVWERRSHRMPGIRLAVLGTTVSSLS